MLFGRETPHFLKVLIQGNAYIQQPLDLYHRNDHYRHRDGTHKVSTLFFNLLALLATDLSVILLLLRAGCRVERDSVSGYLDEMRQERFPYGRLHFIKPSDNSLFQSYMDEAEALTTTPMSLKSLSVHVMRLQLANNLLRVYYHWYDFHKSVLQKAGTEIYSFLV